MNHMLRLSLILFLAGVLLIVFGNAAKNKGVCNRAPVIKYLPRHVYDSLILDSEKVVTPSTLMDDMGGNTK
jgi:hypothetical protein